MIILKYSRIRRGFSAQKIYQSLFRNARRVRRQSVLLADYEVSETTGQRDPNHLADTYFTVLTTMIGEMERRFTENSAVLLALSACHEMKLESLIPLSNIGIELPSEHELQTAKSYVDRKNRKEMRRNQLLAYWIQ